MKKYELIDEYIIYNDEKLYRIKALKNFLTIKIGDLGGFIKSEKNLSHNDNCWVFGNANNTPRIARIDLKTFKNFNIKSPKLPSNEALIGTVSFNNQTILKDEN